MAPLLVAEGLQKRFGAFTAVDQFDLAVEAGEIVGLLGPNGAGKTTTIGMLTGLLRPTAGRVQICGYDVQQQAEEVKRRIGYVPDEPYLYTKLTAREFITFMGQVYGIADQLKDRVNDLLTYFDLRGAADELIGGYSHGMKQKTALCGMLIHNPTVLFLDEPTVGLDPRSARLLKDSLRRLADEGQAVLLCTHILEIAQVICDRVVILDGGRIIAQGSLDQLRRTARSDSQETLEEVFLRLTAGDEEFGLARTLVAE